MLGRVEHEHIVTNENWLLMRILNSLNDLWRRLDSNKIFRLKTWLLASRLVKTWDSRFKDSSDLAQISCDSWLDSHADFYWLDSYWL